MPAWALLLIVAAYPLARAVWLSLTDRRIGQGDPSFVGIGNYSSDVLSPRFLDSLATTLLFVGAGLAIQFIGGYFLAEALVRPLRMVRAFRTGLMVPMLMTPVAVGLMWRFMLNPELGLIRWMAGLVGVESLNVFGDAWQARAVVVLVDSWINLPFVTILLLAGLLGVSRDLIESASVDGAGIWQARRHVLIPSIGSVITVGLVIRFVATFHLFDVAFAVTQGGPGRSTQNLSLLAYEQAFENRSLGKASAIAVAIALLTIPAFLVFARMIKENTVGRSS